MTDTQSLSERLRDLLTAAMFPERRAIIEEAADALDALDAEIDVKDFLIAERNAEIERLREALRNVDAKMLEDLDRATRNRGARVAT